MNEIDERCKECGVVLYAEEFDMNGPLCHRCRDYMDMLASEPPPPELFWPLP